MTLLLAIYFVVSAFFVGTLAMLMSEADLDPYIDERTEQLRRRVKRWRAPIAVTFAMLWPVWAAAAMLGYAIERWEGRAP